MKKPFLVVAMLIAISGFIFGTATVSKEANTIPPNPLGITIFN